MPQTLPEELGLNFGDPRVYISRQKFQTKMDSLLLTSAIVVGSTAWYWYTGWMNDSSTPTGAFLLPRPARAIPSHPLLSRSTDFDSYLACNDYKAEAKARPETDFENWIRKPDPKTTMHKFTSAETSDSEEVPPPAHLKPVGVLYGTEFGLSREVCEKLCEKLIATNSYHPMLLSMDDYPSGLDLTKLQALLVACSTQGEGVPPTDARAFCQWLQGDKAPAVPELKFSVCALGDTSYTHFAQCGKDVDARLERLAGPSNRFAPRVDVNKEDWAAIDGWIDSVLTGLDALELRTIEELGGNGHAAVAAVVSGAVAGGDGVMTSHSYSKSRPYVAEIVAVSNLCSITGTDDKNTIRVDIDLGDSGLTYQPGDSLGVWPQNNPAAVGEIIALMGWDADEMLARPTWHYKSSVESSAATSKNAKMSLRDLLTTCYDLKALRPDLLEYLETNFGVSPGVAGDRAAYLEARHVVDVLRDVFSAQKADGNATTSTATTKPPAASSILKYLRQLVPRLYSISSTPLDDPTKVTLTVAVVEYEQLGIGRQGVCSTYLNDRVAPGSKVPVYIYDNPDFRLPESSTTPIVMVGPGTGVAPFRSFVRHRALATPASAPMKASENLLFFGSRRRDQDFLYGDEFDAMHRDDKLNLITAFSREQTQKVYVQHRIKEHADLIWNALENNGHFYICGDGEHMSSAVESALEELIAARGGGTAADAKAYVANLVATHRFQKDVWC